MKRQSERHHAIMLPLALQSLLAADAIDFTKEKAQRTRSFRLYLDLNKTWHDWHDAWSMAAYS